MSILLPFLQDRDRMDMGHEEAQKKRLLTLSRLLPRLYRFALVSWPHARSLNPLKPVEAMAKGLSGKVRH